MVLSVIWDKLRNLLRTNHPLDYDCWYSDDVQYEESLEDEATVRPDLLGQERSEGVVNSGENRTETRQRQNVGVET